ncbi:MAG: hypothetical protein ACHQ4H_10745 [Ktedonobacterales bacterium]
MADAGWGQRRTAESENGLLPVLQAYVAQGGQLYGARRWADNPLTLTHVRWQGVAGMGLDCFRRPGDEALAAPEEREIWVQLALHIPSAHPSPPGHEAPWLPLAIAREQADAWARTLARMQQAQRASAPQNQYASQRSPWQAQDSGPVNRPIDSGAGGYVSGMPQRGEYASGDVWRTPSYSSPAQASRPLRPDITSRPSPLAAGGNQHPDQWHRPSPELPEVTLLPSVEIELPPAIPGVQAYQRDFARDVALVFARTARALPQVREVRGWMRGERLVLAARYVVGQGNRAATYAEMESAMQHLASALAQRTLPHAWLGFAEPGEWSQGAQLPE